MTRFLRFRSTYWGVQGEGPPSPEMDARGSRGGGSTSPEMEGSGAARGGSGARPSPPPPKRNERFLRVKGRVLLLRVSPYLVYYRDATTNKNEGARLLLQTPRTLVVPPGHGLRVCVSRTFGTLPTSDPLPERDGRCSRLVRRVPLPPRQTLPWREMDGFWGRRGCPQTLPSRKMKHFGA